MKINTVALFSELGVATEVPTSIINIHGIKNETIDLFLLSKSYQQKKCIQIYYRKN